MSIFFDFSYFTVYFFGKTNTVIYMDKIKLSQIKLSQIKLSKMRQEFGLLLRELIKLRKVVLSRNVFMKGRVYELRRKCGKSYCGCAGGKKADLHPAMVISWFEDGKTKLRTVPPSQLSRFKTLTERYKKFRLARARFVELSATILRLIDRIEEQRRE